MNMSIACSVCVCVCARTCTSLQLCLTLWDPMDGSPAGSSAYGIFQARILEWVSISSSRIFLTDPEIKPTSPASSVLAGGFFTTELSGKPRYNQHKLMTIHFIYALHSLLPPSCIILK